MHRLLNIFAYFCLALALATASASASEPQTDDQETLRRLLKEAIYSAESFTDRFEAEVWLVDMSNRLKPIIKDDEKRLRLLKKIHYEATRANLPPELVLAVIEVESRFDRFAISSAGALGLMQVMPFWLNEIGRPDDNLFDIHTNLRMGCTILRYYMDKSKGNLTHALARYNGSLYSHSYTSKVYRALDRRWRCINC